MGNEWVEIRLGEAFEVNPLRSIPRGQLTPFIPMDAISGYSRIPHRIDKRKFTGSGIKFKNGDTLIARITPCLENGKTIFVKDLPEGVIAHGSTEYIVLSEKSDCTHNLFAYYLAISPDFRRYAIGHMEGTSGRQRVPSIAIQKYVLQLPPLSEQYAIANILGILDDKIELNQKMNKTLEAIVQALFTSWFVNFDGIETKDMCESEIGLIPKGWAFLPLAEVTSHLNRGLSPRYTESDGVLVLNQKCIRNNFVDFTKARRHDHVLKKINGRELQIGDILVNSTGVGTLGRVAQILHLSERTIVDSHVTIVRAASIVTSNYLGLNLLGRQEEIEALGEGSTGQTELSRANLGRLHIIVPPLEIIKQFDQITQPLRNRSSLILLENDSLASIRDLLLPQLISGQLRIKDAEKFLESHI